MSYCGMNRRQVIRLLLSLPVAYTVGCEPEQQATTALKPLLSPEESLRKLILLLGPWPASDRVQADDFAQRFLKSDHAAGYLPRSAEPVRSLAGRFPDETMSLKEISLEELPPKERQLLMTLVQQLYSLVEVRFYVSNEPPWGECQGDRSWYTKEPVSRKS